jgi:hypothetical protein
VKMRRSVLGEDPHLAFGGRTADHLDRGLVAVQPDAGAGCEQGRVEWAGGSELSDQRRELLPVRPVPPERPVGRGEAVRIVSPPKKNNARAPCMIAS